MDVCRTLDVAGIDVELAVTLDPVGRLGPGANQPKPQKLKRWLNIYVDYSNSKAPVTTPDGIAMLGGPWGRCQNADINMTLAKASQGNNYGHYGHANAYDMFELSNFADEVRNVS